LFHPAIKCNKLVTLNAQVNTATNTANMSNL